MPDMRTELGSAVRCEMVMGCDVEDSKRREEDSHVKRVVNAMNHPRRRRGKWCRGRRSVHVPLRKWAVNGLRR